MHMSPVAIRAVIRRVAICVGLAAVLRANPEATRVVSQTVGTDELLLAVAAPGQIAALSSLSRRHAYSAVADQAGAYPQLPQAADAESVLKYSPTLVLCADYSRAELVAQLRRAGVKVIVFDRYYSLEDDYNNLRRLARELGPTAEARAAPVSVIAPSTYGIIPGDDSTFQDLCDHAGADNVASTLGHLHGHEHAPDEQMLTWPVDKVVVAGADLASALAPFRAMPPYKYMAAVRKGRAVLIKPWQLGCVSFHRVDAYEALARALHPEAFR
jgi:iron complex transport system substrate-binding protein